MAPDVRRDEGTHRNDLKTPLADVVQRACNELLAESAPFQPRNYLGVDQRYDFVSRPVQQISDELAVEQQFVAVSGALVSNRRGRARSCHDPSDAAAPYGGVGQSS
jgi:hypothetical protein